MATSRSISPGRRHVAFNGEIYNFVELRAELQGRGCSFESTGDAEVLLKGWLEWGIDLLPRLNGMWAFAIYDERRKGLLLARDRFGEKPLFTMPWAGGIAFASEVKQLARYPGVGLQLRPEAAARFITTGRPYDGFSSWFKGIDQLPPGTWLWIEHDGTEQRGTYWNLGSAVAAVQPETTPEAWADRFGAQLKRSVMLRLRSDVPVGTSLSAGVDSSAIAAEITELGHSAYHSYTVGADEATVNETQPAGCSRVRWARHGIASLSTVENSERFGTASRDIRRRRFRRRACTANGRSRKPLAATGSSCSSMVRAPMRSSGDITNSSPRMC